MAFVSRIRSLTGRATLLLLAFVTFGILIVGLLAYRELVVYTQQNADIRIDRAARAASVIVEHRLGHGILVERNARGIPIALRLRQDLRPDELAPVDGFDRLLAEVAATNQGSANFFTWNRENKVFDRFATTFRRPDGSLPPALPIAEGHPAYAASAAGKPFKGNVPLMGRLRLACLVPILAPDGAVAGLFSIDVGWVDDLVEARNQLRDHLAYSVLAILAVVASVGALLLRAQLKPVKLLAGYASLLADSRADTPVPFRDRKDEVGHLADGLARVSELQDRLEDLAYRDPVTDLANRSRFLLELEAAMASPSVKGAVTGLVLLDLDRFKQVNDAHGHVAGDAMLREVGNRIAIEVPSARCIARMGGDEFAVLIDGTDEIDLSILCTNLVATIARPVILPEGEVYTNASLGVALLPRDATNARDAYRNADLALRQSKTDGRARFTFFRSGLEASAQRAMELASMLRTAIAHGGLHLNFQPQIQLAELRLFGLEALVRWTDPKLGSISPSEFVPVAESNGLIVELGDWVLEETCRVGRSWLDGGFNPVSLSVNVSAIQLWQPQFISKVADALERHRIPTAMLVIEVTESVFLNRSEDRVVGVLSRLRDLGVRVALDDFGSGYSSLDYLNRLPLDQIKIDRSFIGGVDRDSRRQSILKGIIAIATGLKLDIVAEGAELPEEVSFLESLKCPVVQGFYFGRPVPVDAVPGEVARIQGSAAQPLVEVPPPMTTPLSVEGTQRLPARRFHRA